MKPRPIRVLMAEPTGKLDDMSRLNLGFILSIQHNVRVKHLGNVHPDSLEDLSLQLNKVNQERKEDKRRREKRAAKNIQELV